MPEPATPVPRKETRISGLAPTYAGCMPTLGGWGRRTHRRPDQRAAGHAETEETAPDSMPDFLELPPSVILRQSRWHGRFLGLHEEMAYQRWHAIHWIPRLQLVMLICGLVGLVSFCMGISGGGAVALKASLMRAYPDKAWLLYLTRILACLLPVMCSAMLSSKRAREVVVARRLYPFIPMITWAAIVVLESAPTIWLAAQRVERSVQSLHERVPLGCREGAARSSAPPEPTPPETAPFVRPCP